MLNGVSVARRTWLNPASRSKVASWRSPAEPETDLLGQ
jgi:hypothetical protein